jgi:hypothetical protein
MKLGSKQKLQDRLAYELWLSKETKNAPLQRKLEAMLGRVDIITFTPSGTQEFRGALNVLTADPSLSELYNWETLRKCP